MSPSARRAPFYAQRVDSSELPSAAALRAMKDAVGISDSTPAPVQQQQENTMSRTEGLTKLAKALKNNNNNNNNNNNDGSALVQALRGRRGDAASAEGSTFRGVRGSSEASGTVRDGMARGRASARGFAGHRADGELS